MLAASNLSDWRRPRPLITIGLTAFNASDSIARAVESALSQTWRPLEVIVADDASTDSTLNILRDLAAKHPELRVYSAQENAGVAVARNRILAASQGEFLAFFDDDDVSVPERIATQYARIVDYEREFAGGAPVICHSARTVLYPDGESRYAPTMGQTEGRKAPAGPAVARRILMGEPLEDGYGACPTCSQMARLSTYRQLGGFDPQLRRGEDTEFNIRLAQAGGHFVGVAQALVLQTMTPTSEKSMAEEYRNMRYLLEKHRALMESAGQYEFCLRWLGVKQAWLTRRSANFAKELLLLVLRYPMLTMRRLALALPNWGLNRAFSRFHGHRNAPRPQAVDRMGQAAAKLLPLDGGQESLARVTVGITCFNAAATIQRALDSALSQDWPNLEVLVVDDGSSDGSRELLAKAAAADTRIRVIAHTSNRGCAAARNTLVESASGDFLAFFDDDDVSSAHRVRLQHNRLLAYEREMGTQMVACYASGQRIYPNGYVVPIRAVGVDGEPPVGLAMADYLLSNRRRKGVFYGAGTPTCSLMARTVVFRGLGGFDAAMRRQEDVDFAVRLAFKGGHFIGIPEPVLSQYATGGGEKGANVEFESFLRLLNKNADYLRADGSYSYMRLWSEMRYRHFAGQDARAAWMLARLMLSFPLRTFRHFAGSASRRFIHERRMKSPSRG